MVGLVSKKNWVDIGDIYEECEKKIDILSQNLTFQTIGKSILKEVYVEGHADYLRRLFFILIDNAINYTSEGSITCIFIREEHFLVMMLNIS